MLRPPRFWWSATAATLRHRCWRRSLPRCHGGRGICCWCTPTGGGPCPVAARRASTWSCRTLWLHRCSPPRERRPRSRDALAAGLASGPPELLEDVAAQLQATPSLDTAVLYAAAGQERAARRDGPAAMPADTAAILLHAVRDVTVRDACTIWHDEAAVRLWLDLLPAAPAGWVAPVATLLAAAAYQRGNGALAVLALERALDDDPGYNLAHLLEQVTATGIPPHTFTAVLTQALDLNPAHPPRPPDRLTDRLTTDLTDQPQVTSSRRSTSWAHMPGSNPATSRSTPWPGSTNAPRDPSPN
jgi:hypothetical protein